MEESARLWLEKIETQLREMRSETIHNYTELIRGVGEINVHLKYSQERMETLSGRVVKTEGRLTTLEASDEKRKGEMVMLRWIGIVIGTLAVALQPIVAWLKG